MYTQEQCNVEFWEYNYLQQTAFMLTQDERKMINSLNSKDEIKDDWVRVQKKATDIDKGAERVYHWLLHQIGLPNSTPIGSDLLFETHNAYIHIDIKTVSYYYYTGKSKKRNTSDFYGVVNIGENQTSYKFSDHTANLPYYYTPNKQGEKTKKLCLTYVIQLIHDIEEDGNLRILAVVFISVPNGLLKDIYKDDICGGSKNLGKGLRYYYSRNPYFQTLQSKPYRFINLYLHESIKDKLKKGKCHLINRVVNK